MLYLFIMKEKRHLRERGERDAFGWIDDFLPMVTDARRVQCSGEKQHTSSFRSHCWNQLNCTIEAQLMATTNSQGGKYRADHEIEKYRLELNWTKILDKIKTLKVSGSLSRLPFIVVNTRAFVFLH